jgi:FAD:protein FMN transferase
MKQFLSSSLFLWLKTFLTIKEWTVLGLSVILSSLITTSIWFINPTQAVVVPYQIIGANIPIRNYLNERLSPFYSIFFTAYESIASEEDQQHVLSTVSSLVPTLHTYADRQELFYRDKENPELGFIHNLAMLNAHYGDNTRLEIDQYFYELLSTSLTMATLTDGRFNPFLGSLSDFWNTILSNPFYPLQFRELDPTFNPLVRRQLETLLSYIPKTPSEMENTLVLTEENGKYFAQFNTFNDAPLGSISISLGAIAKGFANDIIADALSEQSLNQGYIFNGSSSITAIGPRYGNRPYDWFVESPLARFEEAFQIQITGRHRLSTSGAYGGRMIKIGSRSVLRHHILSPLTGFPTQQSIELNVISKTFPAGALDALSTAFMVMNQEEALNIQKIVQGQGYDIEIAWIEVDNDDLIVTHTEGYQPYMIKTEGVMYRSI